MLEGKLDLETELVTVVAWLFMVSWSTQTITSSFISEFGDYTQAVEKAMAPHSSTLAWRIPWTEEPGGLQSMRSLKVGQDWATSLSHFTPMHWRRKWQPTPVFLPGEYGRLPSLGSHRVGHDWSDLAAAAVCSWKHCTPPVHIPCSLSCSPVPNPSLRSPLWC